MVLPASAHGKALVEAEVMAQGLRLNPISGLAETGEAGGACHREMASGLAEIPGEAEGTDQWAFRLDPEWPHPEEWSEMRRPHQDPHGPDL